MTWFSSTRYFEEGACFGNVARPFQLEHRTPDHSSHLSRALHFLPTSNTFHLHLVKIRSLQKKTYLDDEAGFHLLWHEEVLLCQRRRNRRLFQNTTVKVATATGGWAKNNLEGTGAGAGGGEGAEEIMTRPRESQTWILRRYTGIVITKRNQKEARDACSHKSSPKRHGFETREAAIRM